MPSREEIIQVSLELFLKHGYINTPLSRIADAVGIKKASLYAHFKNKEDIGRSVMVHLLEETEGHNLDMNRYPVKDLVHMFIQSGIVGWSPDVKSYHSHDTLFSELLYYFPDYRDKSHSLMNSFNRSLIKRLEKAVREGEIRDTLDPEVLAWELVTIPKGFHYLQNISQPYETELFQKIADNFWDRIKPE